MQGSQRQTKGGRGECEVGDPTFQPTPAGVPVIEGDKLDAAEGDTKAMALQVSSPRHVFLTRSPDYGFGFTLRHFIVYPPEDPTEIGTLDEEVLFSNRQEPLDTIFVRQVRENSPAHLAGLTTGDRILSVNEFCVQNHSYQEIVAIIQTSRISLKLVVVPQEYDLLQQVFSNTAHNPESNLNVQLLPLIPVVIVPAFSSSSSWSSSRSSLCSVIPIPSPISHQPPNPSPFLITTPRNPINQQLIAPAGTLASSSMPVFPAHRKPQGPLSLSKGILPQSNHLHYGHATSSNGQPFTGGARLIPVSSSQSQSRRKHLVSTSKDSNKRRSQPLVMDRKQAVYNIKKEIKTVNEKGASELNVNRNKGNSAEKRSSSNTKDGSDDSVFNIKNIRTVSPDAKNIAKRSGVYEPVMVKGEIIGHGEPKKLEKDPDGRLYEVVQTRLVPSKMVCTENPDLFNKRLSLPIVQTYAESQASLRKDSSQYLSNLYSNPSKTAKMEQSLVTSSASDLNRNLACSHSNKENIAKTLNTSALYTPDRTTREVIERIKKNVERKEEFLKRPNEPLWKPQKDFTVHREYYVSPQKMQRPMWPPPLMQTPPSPGSITKALPFALGPRGDGCVLRRTLSEIDSPRTVSFPPTTSSSDFPFTDDVLTSEVRSNSLPSSPTTSAQESGLIPFLGSTYSSSHHISSLPGSLYPLVGNIVAKPYSAHLKEDGSLGSKVSKPFISTLTRIHENIPSSCRDLSSVNDEAMITSSSSSTPISFPPLLSTPNSTPAGSQTSLSSLTTPSQRPPIPLAWIGDNERIKQLQIVSTRAKKFETANFEKDSRKTALHRFELSRLSQRANAFNVAHRKKEFERRDNDIRPNEPKTSLNFELGTSFNYTPRLKKVEDSSWRGPGRPSGGVMKSFSDGGSIFAVSKEYLSLPGEPYSATEMNAENAIQGTGNRMMPVGGSKIHCDPPTLCENFDFSQVKPLNDTELYKSNSLSSHDSINWIPSVEVPDRRRSSPLIRQHSFHTTLQSHLALADVPDPDLAEATLCGGALIPPSQCLRNEGAVWPHPTGSSAPLQYRPQRPTFLDIKKHARPSAEKRTAGFPLTDHLSMCPHDQGAVSSIQQRINAPSDFSNSHGSGIDAGPLSASNVAAVTKRSKHLYGDENDRLVRRVSYLKATSGDRIYSEEEIESEEEKQIAVSPVSIARRAIGSHETSIAGDLPSPASFLSSVTTHGSLHVKLARLQGKRAGDRSWKSVWAVIRGRALLLYKDKQHALQTPLSPEDQVTLRGADVGVATDYTKRRHVLRLSTPAGSQFLFQAESDPAMTAWLTSITAATSQDDDVSGKPVAPNPEADAVSSSYLDASVNSMATTPNALTSGSLGALDAPHGVSDANISPQAVTKNMKKITSPMRTKSPSCQISTGKPRKALIETGSSPKSKTWKGRLGRHLRKMQGGSLVVSPTAPLPEGASIGVCLEDCPPSAENEFVPMLVALCVGVVESKGLNVQGIYRIPGNRAAVTFLTEVVNRGPKAVDLSDNRWSDVNVISSLLKQFFQKLPDPLITSDLYPHFIEASKIDDPQQRLMELKNLVQELPDHHYETLRFLCFHLDHVTSESSHNKMDVRNLAIVFGPTLVRAADDNMAKMVTDMSHQCRIVEMLISQVNWFFNEDESDDPPPIVPYCGTQSPSTETSLNASEMEASSQSLLLSNVQKLEASQKDTKKLLVSSIISAANRRVQKVRKKVEEESSAVSGQHNAHSQGSFENILAHELPDPLPMSQRRVSNMSISSIVHQNPISATGNLTTGLDRLHGSNRDGRLFSETSDTLFAKDDRLSSLSSLNSLNNLPSSASSEMGLYPVMPYGVVSTVCGDVHTINSIPNTTLSASQIPHLSKSEPSHVGEDVAIRSYAGLSASTQERIRRFEMETRAMLQRDGTKHRRELDKLKIEEELQRAKKDLETEDIFDRLADNPSEVVHMMNDYCWSSNREAISLPSLRPSVPSDTHLKSSGHSLANASLVSSAATTNASAKDDKLSHQENVMNRRPHLEGSDLLSAITATFEEKMKCLQESALLTAEGDEMSQATLNRSSSPSGGSHRPRKEPGASRSSSNNGTKCKLYRDPSLHRRRTLQASAAIKHSASSDAISCSSYDLGSKDIDTDSMINDCLSNTEITESNSNPKEKSEKRTREFMRTETQESLREKKPKELKRSDTQDNFCDFSHPKDPTSVNAFISSNISTRKDKREPLKHSAELKSRKHNVKELKEKFEQNTPKTQPVVGSNVKNANPASGNEKSSRTKSRKARIKRRHTVGGMKDMARVAWLKVIEAAHYADPQKLNQGCQVPSQSSQLPSWEQLQLFLEAFAEGRKMNVDTQALNNWVAREKLGSSTPDLESILSLVLPPQQKEALKRRLSVREPSVKPLYPVLESNV